MQTKIARLICRPHGHCYSLSCAHKVGLWFKKKRNNLLADNKLLYCFFSPTNAHEGVGWGSVAQLAACCWFDDCRIQGPLLLPPIFFLIILLIFFFSLPSGTSWGGHERRGIPLWYAIWLLWWAFRSWGEETRAILLLLLSVCYQPNAKVQKPQKIQKRTPDIPLFTVPLASERNSNIGQL